MHTNGQPVRRGKTPTARAAASVRCRRKVTHRAVEGRALEAVAGHVARDNEVAAGAREQGHVGEEGSKAGRAARKAGRPHQAVSIVA